MIGDLTKALDDFKRACLLDYDDQTHQLQVEIQNYLDMDNKHNNNDFNDKINDSIACIIYYILYIYSISNSNIK